MLTGNNLEVRLTAVEIEVAKLTAVVLPSAEPPWYEKMAGSMRDFPEFEEVARLGREIRLADVSPDPAAPRGE